MRVVVFRAAEAGRLPGDFAHALDGELLTLGFACGDSLEHREACGCGRAFAGVESLSACTTGVVEDRDEDEALSALRASALFASWAVEDDEDAAALEADFRELSRLLPAPGAVVRLRLGTERFEVLHGPRNSRRPRRR